MVDEVRQRSDHFGRGEAEHGGVRQGVAQFHVGLLEDAALPTARVSGAWKEPWSEHELSCSGTWFEGTIEGQSVTGTRYLCSRAPRPLDLKIVDADTLEITVQVPGGTTRPMTLRRIK